MIFSVLGAFLGASAVGASDGGVVGTDASGRGAGVPGDGIWGGAGRGVGIGPGSSGVTGFNVSGKSVMISALWPILALSRKDESAGMDNMTSPENV